MDGLTGQTNKELGNLRRQLEAVTHEYQQLAAVLEQSPDGVLTLAADGTIRLVNRAFERLTGWSRSEALGRSFAGLTAPRDTRARPLDTVAYLLDGSGREPGRYLEGTIRTPSGERLPVGFALAALREPSGALSGAVLTLRDLRRAENSEALRSSFVSVLSHELQTPLSIIKGYASTLARTDAAWSPEQLREGLTVIEEEADRLSRLVGDLLAVSRIQAVGLTAERTPTELGALVSRLVTRFRTAHGEHEFRVEVAPDLPMILADQEKLEIVLRNLLDNATKYAPAGSTVTVRVWHDSANRQVCASVQDEGEGISPEERERVFERFYRVDRGDARGRPGAGLGLFLCRTIVQAHGGRIWVDGGQAQGTTVFLTLPVD